ncbi:DNA alkylation repair protein [Methanococcoides alaskense]|uniref:3-methyladenine DNA glycosylase AlkD n=1 Tax=Methanococcoides alaskense TaxID=325778 RepID=A0AA90Z9I2_9EURY|nr:DNA alkylation repair protein [Methanococcoides alaskense]MDR6223504.1 3-methyladenine DNA glycosylase AlkD [Methanococcoides alaskense]
MYPDFIENIQKELEANIDQDYRNTIRDHFQMNVDSFLGVRMPIVRQIATREFDKTKKINEILSICEELLNTGIYEHKIIAFLWAQKCKKDFLPEHFNTFYRWLSEYVNDWSDCDTLCTNVLGEFLFIYLEFAPQMEKWTNSKNKRVRRGAAVSLILGLRRGIFLKTAFNVADKLLDEKEDLVLKASGWMLKEASKSFQKEVFDYLMENKEVMPRITLCYAAEKMPGKMRAEIMK